MYRNSRTFVGTTVAVVAALAILSGCQKQNQQATGGGGDKKDPDTAQVNVDTNANPDKADPVEVPAAASSALDLVQQQISDYVAQAGTKYSFASYVDPGSGKIILNTDAPADVISRLTEVPNATDEQRAAIKEAQIKTEVTTA